MRTGVDALRSIHRYVWKMLEGDTSVYQDEERDWEIRLWGTEGEFRFPFARVAAITPVTYTGPAVQRDAARTFAVHLYPVPKDSPEASIMEVERIEEIVTVAFETGFTYDDSPLPLIELSGSIADAGVGELNGSYAWGVTALGRADVESEVMQLGGEAAVNRSVLITWDVVPGATGYNVYRKGGFGGWGLRATVIAPTFTDALDHAGVIDYSTQPPDYRVTSAPHRIPLYDYDGVPLDGPDSVSYARGTRDFLRVVSCPINRITDPEDDRYWLVTAEPRVTWRRTGRVPSGTQIVQSVRLTETVT